MNARAFERMCMQIVEEVRAVSPIKTGNLRNNAIRFEWIDANTFRLYVDEKIAPYMPYTNEPWMARRWNGAKNPNELWWDIEAVNAVLNIIREKLKDKIIREGDERGRPW